MPETSSTYEVLDVETARELVREYVEDTQRAGNDAILESTSALAADAANQAAGSVAEQVTRNVESLGSTVVMIDGEQWDYLQSSIRGAAGGSLVALLLLAMVVGLLLSTFIVKGWRRDS